MAEQPTSPDPRRFAEVKTETILDTMMTTDEERAYLADVLVNGLGFGHDKRRLVLGKAGWVR